MEKVEKVEVKPISAINTVKVIEQKKPLTPAERLKMKRENIFNKVV